MCVRSSFEANDIYFQQPDLDQMKIYQKTMSNVRAVHTSPKKEPGVAGFLKAFSVTPPCSHGEADEEATDEDATKDMYLIF